MPAKYSLESSKWNCGPKKLVIKFKARAIAKYMLSFLLSPINKVDVSSSLLKIINFKESKMATQKAPKKSALLGKVTKKQMLIIFVVIFAGIMLKKYA